MVIGSGLGAAFGIVDETTYGTLPGSPTWRWHDTKDKLPDLKLVKNTAQGDGLASGRMALRRRGASSPPRRVRSARCRPRC
jgi:hypothetical protein